MTSNILNSMEIVARNAGKIILENYENVKEIHYKGDIDLVTDTDKRSEEYILSFLQKEFPEYSILSEESESFQTQSEYQWIIDPLDGTTNFVHGIPAFSVSICLLKGDTPIAGVVFDPVHNELFSAALHQGATMNGKPIRVSTETDIGKALIATGFPYDIRTTPLNNLKEFSQFHLRVQSIRRIGSATLDCAWTAKGRLDGYWELGIKPWDVYAGLLIIQEAGGRVTTKDGNNYNLTSSNILVSNGLIHDQMLDILKLK
ncbi:MAG: inositol monophosphatase [Anaerolineales bacterium]|nr:inositol monophosphatase [Anaerolineales bacterium]